MVGNRLVPGFSDVPLLVDRQIGPCYNRRCSRTDESWTRANRIPTVSGRWPSYRNRGGECARSLVPFRVRATLRLLVPQRWRFPRRDEYLRMLEGYRDELQEELTEVDAEIERMKTAKEEKD